MPMTRSFDVFFDLRLNKRLSKESWGWWFEMLLRPLWRHCNAIWLWWQSSLAFIITRINMFKTKFVLSSARPQASEECSLISTSLCSTAKPITTLAPKIPPIDVGWQQWNYSEKYLPANHTRQHGALSPSQTLCHHIHQTFLWYQMYVIISQITDNLVVCTTVCAG